VETVIRGLISACGDRQKTAKSGQLRRANNPSLKLDGVYENRGDSLRVAPLFIVYDYLKTQKAEIAQLLRSATLKIKFMLAS